MNKDEVFINYLLSNRIRKLPPAHANDVYQLYADKYKKWISPFLNKHNIEEIPQLLLLNTLKKTPDFFIIGNKNFFVIDYSMHRYFYDINYIFSDNEFNEYIVNAYIKLYMEKAYLKERIDFCHCLCANTTDIEDYKLTNSYRNDDTIQYLCDKTDLQEMFLLLHEACHLLFCTFDKNVKESEGFQVLKDNLQPIIKINEAVNVDDEFYEECYCDYKSIFYTLEETYFSTKLSNEEYFSLFFLTLVNVYVLQFFERCQNKSYNAQYNFEYDRIALFSMRMANLHATLFNFLSAHNQNDEIINKLTSVYYASLDRAADIFSKAHQISQCLEEEISNSISEYEHLTRKDKIYYIENYLLLVNMNI